MFWTSLILDAAKHRKYQQISSKDKGTNMTLHTIFLDVFGVNLTDRSNNNNNKNNNNQNKNKNKNKNNNKNK